MVGVVVVVGVEVVVEVVVGVVVGVEVGVVVGVEVGVVVGVVVGVKLTFTVPGGPIAKARGRMVPLMRCRKCGTKTARRMCRCGSTELELMTVLNSPDSNTVKYESLVRLCASEAMREQGITMFSGPLSVTMNFWFQIPDSRKCKNHKDIGCKRTHVGDWHLQRPDIDNCKKSCLDGMLQVVYPDDSIVCQIQGFKRWSDVPRAEITVESIESNNAPTE